MRLPNTHAYRGPNTKDSFPELPYPVYIELQGTDLRISYQSGGDEPKSYNLLVIPISDHPILLDFMLEVFRSSYPK